jgi:23S rRNA (uracil1939-C5)-methyltransferase
VSDFELELTAMAHGGSALGRHDNRVVFVPYTIPGEVIEARITEERGRVIFAEGMRLLAPSGDRVFPRCPHFGPGRCGRCQWQHIDYPAQLLLKQDVLADQLDRIGKFADADVRGVLPAPQQWGYNHHMTFTVGDGGLGLPGAGETDPFAIDECHILHPDLLDLFDRLDLDYSGMKRIKFQIGSDGNHMLVLYVDSEDDVPELSSDMPTSVNMLLPDNEPVNLIGDSHVVYTIGGHEFRVTAGSDFRANVAQLPNLAQRVIELVDSDGAVLDLYAGVGFFSAFLAERAALVTLVESYPPAATDADANLADLDHVDVIEGAVEDVLPELEDAYDAAVIDPPADGLTLEALDALVALNIPRLVYVSSDPATLARDARRLVDQGYELGSVQPIDLSPQTYYIDTAAVFDLK